MHVLERIAFVEIELMNSIVNVTCFLTSNATNYVIH